jgi:O-antigen ligase
MAGAVLPIRRRGPGRGPDVGTPLSVLGVCLLALVIAGAGLELVTLRPAALPLFLATVVGLGALALRPVWIVPVFAALTWTAVGQGFFGPISPVETGGLVLLAFAAYRSLTRPLVARDALLAIALVGLPLIATALLGQAGPAMPVGALKDLSFLFVVALGVSSIRDAERLASALAITGLVLGAGAIFSVVVGSTSLFPLYTDPTGNQAARAAGPFGEPNFFALSLAALVPFALHVAGRGGWRLPLGLLSAAALGGGVLATGSRSGVLAAVLALLVHAWLSRERAARFAAVATLVLALLALPVFAAQSNSSFQRTVGGRETENLIAAAMFADHPLVGVGPSTYPLLYRDYTRRIGNDPRVDREPHSLPLQIAAEQGLAGILGWIGLLVLIVRLTIAHRVWTTRVGLTLLVSLGTYAFGSLFLHGSQLRVPYMLVGALIAVAWATDREPEAA